MSSHIYGRLKSINEFFEKWFPAIDYMLILSLSVLVFYAWGPYGFNDPMVWVLFICPAYYIMEMNTEIRRSRKTYFLEHKFTPGWFYAPWRDELREEADAAGNRKILKSVADVMSPATVDAMLSSLSIITEVLATDEEKEKIYQIVKRANNDHLPDAEE